MDYAMHADGAAWRSGNPTSADIGGPPPPPPPALLQQVAPPQQIAAALEQRLPEAHEDQLKLGFSMIDRAFANKVQQLEQELRSLKLNCEESKSQAADLHRKHNALETELLESNQRAQGLAEENRKLFNTVQSLRKQLMRLDSLKKKVLDSISDETTAEDFGPSDQAALRDDYYGSSAAYGAPSSSSAFGAARAPSPLAHQYSPRTAAGAGLLGAPGSIGAAEHGRAPSPSQAGAGMGGIDGKQFFRQARSQLSNDGFNEFLSSIKRLNTQAQSREETLEEARRIFGPDLQHLYRDFEQLLNRHALAP